MKPSEPEWPPETEQEPGRQSWQTGWERRVDWALLHNDAEELASLYRELMSHLPSQDASEVWMRMVSGWDSSAVTG